MSLNVNVLRGGKIRNSLLLIGYYKRFLDINNRIEIITLYDNGILWNEEEY